MNFKKKDNYMKKLSLIAVFILCVALLLDVSQNATCFASEVQSSTITVNGVGEVDISPDKACVRIGVETFNEDLNTANADNTQKTNNIVSYLQQNGIAKDDITTKNYHAHNIMTFTNGQKSLGYKVCNCIDFYTFDLTKISTLINGAMDNSATSFNGVSLDYSDKQTALYDALRLAIESATEKATALAQGESVSIKGIKEQCSFISAKRCNALFAHKGVSDIYPTANMKVIACVEAEFYINQNEDTTTENQNTSSEIDLTQDSLNNQNANTQGAINTPTNNDENITNSNKINLTANDIRKDILDLEKDLRTKSNDTSAQNSTYSDRPTDSPSKNQNTPPLDYTPMPKSKPMKID